MQANGYGWLYQLLKNLKIIYVCYVLPIYVKLRLTTLINGLHISYYILLFQQKEITFLLHKPMIIHNVFVFPFQSLQKVSQQFFTVLVHESSMQCRLISRQNFVYIQKQFNIYNLSIVTFLKQSLITYIIYSHI